MPAFTIPPPWRVLSGHGYLLAADCQQESCHVFLLREWFGRCSFVDTYEILMAVGKEWTLLSAYLEQARQDHPGFTPETVEITVWLPPGSFVTERMTLPEYLTPDEVEHHIFRRIQARYVRNTDREVNVSYSLIPDAEQDRTYLVSVMNPRVRATIEDELGDFASSLRYMGGGFDPDIFPAGGRKFLDFRFPKSIPKPLVTAMRQPGRLNHVHSEQQGRVRAQRGKVWLRRVSAAVAITIISLLVITGILLGLLTGLRHHQHNQIAANQSQFQQYQQISQERQVQITRLNQLRTFNSYRSNVAWYFAQIEILIPPETQFERTRLTYSDSAQATLMIDGRTTRDAALYGLMEQLKQQSYIDTVTLENLSRSNNRFSRFTLQLEVY